MYYKTVDQTHEYRRDEHRVPLSIYHLIWCPRRRQPGPVGPVAARCRELLAGTCTERGWDVLALALALALALQPDHIHLLVRVWPSESATEDVKECPGNTSFHLHKEFPHLLTLPSTWTRNFFASTAGHSSQQTIQRYSDAQTGR